MPQFSYVAIDQNGRRLKQIISADSKIEVANSLKRNNLFIVEIAEVTAKNAKLPTRLALGDKIFFTQNIAVLLHSGMPLSGALSAIIEDTNNKSVAALYGAIKSDLERGFPFSKSLARYPTIFDPVYLSLIEAGENSGKLDEIMDNLAKRLEKDARTISQVRSAFIYPTFIILSLVILGGLIMGFVLPRLIPVFQELQVNLPFTTRILLGTSLFFVRHPYLVTSLFFVTLIGFILFARSYKGRLFFGELANRLPLIKQIIHYLDLFRFSSTMALLMNSGVPIQKAIKISANTIRNVKLKKQIEATADQLSSGSTLAKSLRATTLPKTYTALVSVGERSGNIDFIFKTLSEHYEDMLDTSIKNFTGLIEPILTLVVGLLVGITILSILVPIYQVVGTLGAGPQ